MSTTITTAHDELIAIPDAADVAPSSAGGRVVYRASEGQLVTGREADKTLATVERIVGRVTRISRHRGHGKDDGKPYEQLEADIDTARGPVRLKVGLLNNKGEFAPSVAAKCLAEGLLDVKPGDITIFSTARGSKPNQFGGFSTYVNCERYVDRTRNERHAKVDTKHLELKDAYMLLEGLLAQHPLWADRPEREEDRAANPTHLSELNKEMAERGWPTPEQAPAAWLSYIAAGFEHPVRSSLASYNDDEWGVVRKAILALQPSQMPAQLAAARVSAPGGFNAGGGGGFNAAPAAEYDPHKDR